MMGKSRSFMMPLPKSPSLPCGSTRRWRRWRLECEICLPSARGMPMRPPETKEATPDSSPAAATTTLTLLHLPTIHTVPHYAHQSVQLISPHCAMFLRTRPSRLVNRDPERISSHRCHSASWKLAGRLETQRRGQAGCVRPSEC